MSRKDFKLIAEALKRSNAPARVVQSMADALSGTNPRFDRSRFVEAASADAATAEKVHSHSHW